MSIVYHSGELAVQARVGVLDRAARAGRMIKSAIPPIAAEFMHLQRFAILGSRNAGGRVWSSLLTGEQGFIRTVDERTVRITPQANENDPLSGNFVERCDAGMLIIDFSTRRRMRLNGQAVLSGNELYFQTSQVYSNCPRFIRVRHVLDDLQPTAPYVSRSGTLNGDQTLWINSCDTFFIASYHPDGGADASHRGGPPGFVQVVSKNEIAWPDYAGNSMFNTLGNLSAYPSVGLLFIDFEQGRTLHLTGEAKVVWGPDQCARNSTLQRTVTFQTQEVIELGGACWLRWRMDPADQLSESDALACQDISPDAHLQ